MTHIEIDEKVSEKAKGIRGEVMRKREGRGKEPTYSEIFDRAVEFAGGNTIVDSFVKGFVKVGKRGEGKE